MVDTSPIMLDYYELNMIYVFLYWFFTILMIGI